MKELAKIVIEPVGEHKSTVIWFHGLGASGEDFIDVVQMLGLPESLGVRFIMPHAPIRSVTINSGQHARAWFDIIEIGIDADQDLDGLRENEEYIRYLLDSEVAAGIPSRSIILVGFSQGGAVALHNGLRYDKPLGGILGLSTYLPVQDLIEREFSKANHDTPIHLFHGDFDPLVVVEFGEMSRDILQKTGHQVTWKAYPIEHEVSLEEIEDIGEVLKDLLS